MFENRSTGKRGISEERKIVYANMLPTVMKKRTLNKKKKQFFKHQSTTFMYLSHFNFSRILKTGDRTLVPIYLF